MILRKKRALFYKNLANLLSRQDWLQMDYDDTINLELGVNLRVGDKVELSFCGHTRQATLTKEINTYLSCPRFIITIDGHSKPVPSMYVEKDLKKV